MPDDGRNGGGRFPNRPTDFEVTQFKDFMKETGEPEHYPKLAHTPPDRTVEGHEVLWDFHVPREARPNGDYIPCSACDDRPKYSHGYLIWSPDGEMRLVGSCCGPKYFGAQRFHRMELDARKRRFERDAQDYLIDHLPKIPALIRSLEGLRRTCDNYRCHSEAVTTRLPSLVKAMQRIVERDAGVYAVARKRDPNLAGSPAGFRGSMGASESEYVMTAFGQIQGFQFLRRDFNPVAKLDRFIKNLEQLAVDDSLEAVANLDSNEIIRTITLFKRVIRRAIALHAQLQRMPEFFSDRHLQTLQDWGADPDCNIHLRVSFKDGHVHFQCGNERLRVFLADVNSVPGVGSLASIPT